MSYATKTPELASDVRAPEGQKQGVLKAHARQRASRAAVVKPKKKKKANA